MNAILLFVGLGLHELLVLFFTIGFFVLVFLACRSLLLWYWKINVIVENQEKQIVLLNKIIERGSSSIAERARKYDEMTKQ